MDRIVTGDKTEEEVNEDNIRPQRLDEYVGQSETKKRQICSMSTNLIFLPKTSKESWAISPISTLSENLSYNLEFIKSPYIVYD